MVALSIVMPCFNRAHDLRRLLEAYDQQRGDEPFELIAVDDASTDSTYQVLSSYRPARYTLRVQRLSQNSGPAAARNRGIQLVKAPVVLFVGDDILPHPDLVRGHLVAHRHYAQPNLAILGKIVWPPDLPVNTLMAHIDAVGAQQFSYYYLRDGQDYDFRHFYTSNVSVKREMLFSLDHWFDTDFIYAALEDAELAYRLSRQGLRIVYSSWLLAYHYHYHTIWTFAERQRRAGMMLSLLTRKHPRLRYFFRAQYTRLLRLLIMPRAFLTPFPEDELNDLEGLACRLASFYEWGGNPLLEKLYLDLLDYFFFTGVIQAMFSKSRLVRRLRSAHARRYLLPALYGFIRGAQGRNIPLPDLQIP